LLALLAASAATLSACGETITNHYYKYNYHTDGGAPESAAGEGGAPSSATGEGGAAAGDVAAPEGGKASRPEPAAAGAGAGGEDSGIDPRYPGAPVSNTELVDFELDIFGVMGNRYWFAVTDEQRLAMNQDWGGGNNGDIYQPNFGGNANWVDHLWVTSAGESPQIVDYGKVQVRVVGGSTRRDWDERNIPNLNVDADQFVKNQRIAGYEHLRFSNGQIGTIFRDHFAYRLYEAMSYPAPLTTYAWVSSNVWGADVSIPYTLVERYKRTFCTRYADDFGGGCANMWEYWGDFNGYFGDVMGVKESLFDEPQNCQIDQCDATRVKELEAKLRETPPGEGFKAALVDYIDWPAFHRFQCLSWVFSTTDDPIHASNNVVLLEGNDGYFRYLPYSVDISLGLWEGYVSLHGGGVLPTGCQEDPTCWEDTLDECEAVISEFTSLDPNAMLATIYDQLKEQDMLRAGDDDRYRQLDSWLTRRLESLPAELQDYRDGSFCKYPEVDCGGHCEYLYCHDQCIPPGKGEPGPIPMAAIGVGGSVGVGGGGQVGGSLGIAGGGHIGGGGPIICPMEMKYELLEP
jgi:hypothetical protein